MQHGLSDINKKTPAKMAAGQGHPAFDDSRISATVQGPYPVDDQRANFTPKLMSTRCKDVSGDDRVTHASKIVQGRDGHTFKYSDAGTDRQGLVKDLKRSKGGCGSWGAGVDNSGCHVSSDSPPN